MNKLIEAIDFAAKAHRDQRRKDENHSPYINHPIDVMNILSKAGISDIDTLCAAVLHDTIEDTKVTFEQLETTFGPEVAQIVKECSDDKSLHKVQRKKDQIVHARHASTNAKLVKAADKLSNLSDLQRSPPSFWSQDEIEGYFIWAFHVYMELESALPESLNIQLREIFEARGIMDKTPHQVGKELESYYENIHNSE